MPTVFSDPLTGPSLDAAWTEKGTFTKSFSGSGAGFTGVGAGEGIWLSLAALGITTEDFTFEVGLTKSTTSSMTGLVICDDTFAGRVLAHYSSPAGMLWLSATSSWGYGNTFTTVLSETAQTSARYRIRRVGSTCYCSRSLDNGSTWSTESAQTLTQTPTRIGVADLLGNVTLSNVKDFTVTATIAATNVSGGTAHETDTASAGTVATGAVSVAGGTGHETDTAHAGSVVQAAITAGGTGHETDSAHGGTTAPGAFTVAGGTSSETDAAHAGTVTAPVDVEEDESQEYAPTLPDPVAPSFAGTIRPMVTVATSLPFPTLVDGRPT